MNCKDLYLAKQILIICKTTYFIPSEDRVFRVELLISPVLSLF